MYIHIYVNIYIEICLHIYVYTYIYICTCVHIFTYICIYIYIYVYIYTYVSMYLRTHKNSIHQYIYIRTQRNICQTRQFGTGWRRPIGCLKGGPEPLEKEINEILDSKREDRLSDPFFELVQRATLVRFSYLLRLCNFCKAPRDMRKFPQKCQKIAGY